MTAYCIYMGEMRALINLKRLCLLDEMPDRELLIYDNVVWDSAVKRKSVQRSLAECAEEITRAIDMEDFLREDFSVVIYAPAQMTPSFSQDSHEVPHIAALEILYALQIQYDLFSKFWSSGKYPCRIHMIFGEFADFSEHVKDVFSAESTKLQEALWQELLPDEELKESYQSKDWTRILQKAENGAWSCLKGLNLKKQFARYRTKQTPDLTGKEMQNALVTAVLELFWEINKMNAGRMEKTNEQETVVSMDHMLLEKNYDLHEQTRNEALLFLYVYSGAWQKSKGELLSKEQSRPDLLVKNAGTLPLTRELKNRAGIYLRQKYDELTRNLLAIDPDRALRLSDQYSKEQRIAIDEHSIKPLQDAPTQRTAEGSDQTHDIPAQKRGHGFHLLFQSINRTKADADRLLDSIQDESTNLDKRIQDYAKSLEASFNESKYRELHRIEQEILNDTEAFEEHNIDLEGSFLSIAQDNVSWSMNSVQKEILDIGYKRIVWPQDISKAVEDTRKQVKWLYKHMAWKHWLLRILAAAVFMALFMAPYLWLSRRDLSAVPRLIALCVTAGAVLCAYVFSEHFFLWRYKRTVEKLTDDLNQQWIQCKHSVLASGEHFKCTLLEYVPRLFSQYQYAERLNAIKEISDTRRSKITYHKKRLAVQLKVISSLASEMDIPLEKKRTDSNSNMDAEESARGSELNIQLDFSTVSGKNRALYGLPPQTALELIGLEQAREDK